MTKPEPTERERRVTEAEKQRLTQTQLSGRWISFGIQMAISIVLGLLGGTWLDEKFGTDPWFTLLGILLGAAAAFYDMYRLARQTTGRK